MNEKKFNNDVSSTLLIVFVVITFITSVGSAIIQSLVDNWHKASALIFILLSMQILRTVSYILPALAIKNRTYKIVGIILTSIMVVYLLCGPILTMAKFYQTAYNNVRFY